MKDLFKHASSSWVKYDRYEWKKDKNNKFYITPAPNAMPKIYDPLKEYQQMVEKQTQEQSQEQTQTEGEKETKAAPKKGKSR